LIRTIERSSLDPSRGLEVEEKTTRDGADDAVEELNRQALAMLGIVVRLGGRYSPQQLAASVGSQRVGLAGLIIDRLLGADAEIDEESAKQLIEALCEKGFVRINSSRRLESTGAGNLLWERIDA
jgi:hypothetical protein